MTMFTPGGDTLSLALNGTTSVRGALNKPTTNGSIAYTVGNADSGWMFVRFGGDTVTASDSDFPIPPNAVAGMDVGAGATHVAVVAPGSATGKVYVTPVYVGGRP